MSDVCISICIFILFPYSRICRGSLYFCFSVYLISNYILIHFFLFIFGFALLLFCLCHCVCVGFFLFPPYTLSLFNNYFYLYYPALSHVINWCQGGIETYLVDEGRVFLFCLFICLVWKKRVVAAVGLPNTQDELYLYNRVNVTKFDTSSQ